jgi:hypothetical protein
MPNDEEPEDTSEMNKQITKERKSALLQKLKPGLKTFSEVFKEWKRDNKGLVKFEDYLDKYGKKKISEKHKASLSKKTGASMKDILDKRIPSRPPSPKAHDPNVNTPTVEGYQHIYKLYSEVKDSIGVEKFKIFTKEITKSNKGEQTLEQTLKNLANLVKDEVLFARLKSLLV